MNTTRVKAMAELDRLFMKHIELGSDYGNDIVPDMEQVMETLKKRIDDGHPEAEYALTVFQTGLAHIAAVSDGAVMVAPDQMKDPDE